MTLPLTDDEIASCESRLAAEPGPAAAEALRVIAGLRAERDNLRRLDAQYGRVEVAIVMADRDFDGDSDHAGPAERLIASVERLRDRADAASETVLATLAERMARAGMIPEDALLAPGPLSVFTRHAAVRDLDSFLWLVATRRRQYARIQAAQQTEREGGVDDVEDFILGKSAAWSEVWENVRVVFPEAAERAANKTK